MYIDIRSWSSLSSLALATTLAMGCVVEDEGTVGDPWSGEQDEDEATSEDEADEPQALDESEEEIFGYVVGDMVEVEDGIELPVPEPGRVIAIDIVYDDGATASASLAHDLDGRMRIIHPDDHLLALPENSSAMCASKCSDGSFSYVFGAGQAAKWKSRLDWYYRHTNSPIGKNNALNAFKSAAAAVPSSRNSCNLSDNVSATHSYRGETTTRGSVVVSSGVISCHDTRSFDGFNVIEWGGLPGSTLAVTCTSAYDDGGSRLRISDMDMRYDKDRNWFHTNTLPGGCSGRFSLRGTATHEFGHAYGLGHTSQCNQVMAPSTDSCTTANRKFGRGDVLGLRNLY